MGYNLQDTRVKVFVLFLYLFGFLSAVNSDIASEVPSIQDLEKHLSDNLPEGIPKIPLKSSQLPTQEDVKQLFKEKCERLAGPGSFQKYEGAVQEVIECVKSLVNVTELQQEIDAAKPVGDLDVVFQKYCRKSPIFMKCVLNFTTSVEPCLEEKEKESKQIIMNITEALLGFLCFKEGDRIALFIAEGGPECLQSQLESITQCANSTFDEYMPAKDSSTALSQLPPFVIDEKKCKSFRELQNCTVNVLERCSEPTPANIVESLFHLIEKRTPCKEILSEARCIEIRRAAEDCETRIQQEIPHDNTEHIAPSPGVIFEDKIIEEATQRQGITIPEMQQETPCEGPTFSKPRNSPRNKGVAKKSKLEDEFLESCSRALKQLEPTLDELDGMAISWAAKLRKLDKVQKVYAESLIGDILKKGFFHQLDENTVVGTRTKHNQHY